MRIFATFWLVLALCCLTAFARAGEELVGPRPMSENLPMELSGKIQFSEKLVYMAKWTGFPAGSITTRVWPHYRNLKGREVFMFRMNIEGNDFFNMFYPVKTELQSLVEPHGGWSYLLRRRVWEGDYRGNDRVAFDYQKKDELGKLTPVANVGLIRAMEVEEQQPVPIPGHLCDPLSFLWYMRSIPLKDKGDRATVLMSDRYGTGLISLEVDRIENLDLPGLGTFRCLVVRPHATTYDGEQSLISVEGDALLWLEENTRILLRAQARLPIGQASATLVFQENTSLLKYALKIKSKSSGEGNR